MGRSRFIELMIKSMDGTASSQEQAELDVFLEQNPSYKNTKQVTDALTGNLKGDSIFFDKNHTNNKLDELWLNINDSVKQPDAKIEPTVNVRSFAYARWISAAAVAMLAVFGFMFYKYQVKNEQPAKLVIKEINVPLGKMMQVTLTDGTKVKLNAGSHFTYPSAFSARVREVSLNGEGFFEVTKDAAKPFLVHTAGFTVKVLGTVFNVKAYRNDRFTETTLLRGKVQVELADDPEKKIILSPHEKLTINNLVKTDIKQPVKETVAKIKYEVATLPDISGDTYPENAWTKNKIMFANNYLEDVARQMERKYAVNIVFEDEALKKEQISGVLENESLETALNFLKQIVALQTKTEGNTVYLAYKIKK